MHGTLFLIVGPSGAGKDTLIAAARERLRDGYLFQQRTIARPVQPGGEVHIPDDATSFEAHESAGAFALSWRAHGTAYGIPATIAADLARGTHLVVNVSRTVVAKARAQFQPSRVVLVTASPAVLDQRLHARGREDQGGIDERLGRVAKVQAHTVIVNDGALEPAIDAFVTALKG